MSGPRKAGLPLSVSPSGACGTLERFTAPAAPGMATRNRHTRRPAPCGTGQPLPESRRRGHLRFTPLEGSPPRKQVLRPAFRTRMDFAACCMSRLASFLLTRPRSCKLLPGHALGPSARVAGRFPRNCLKNLAILQAIRSPASWRPPQPAPRHENAHEAPLTGAGWEKVSPGDQTRQLSFRYSETLLTESDTRLSVVPARAGTRAPCGA